MPAWLQWLIVVLFPAAWIIFCLFGIHWKRAWAALREGAWIPFLLLLVFVSMLWSLSVPSELSVFGYFRLPNFWWQLAATIFVVGTGLFAGWVQDRYSWYPQGVAVEPPQHAESHGHGHHGHHGADNHDTPALD